MRDFIVPLSPLSSAKRHLFGEYLAPFELSLFFATNTSIPYQKCMSRNGRRQKGGTILIGKDRTLTEQAVLKRKRRNDTARGMEHYRKTNGERGSKE